MRRNATGVIAVVAFLTVLLWASQRPILAYLDDDRRPFTIPSLEISSIQQTVIVFTNDPIVSPYKYRFWDVGQRLKTLSTWLSALDQLNGRTPTRNSIAQAIEAVSASMLPFLGTATSITLQALRSTYKSGSRGIVIPVGAGHDNLRFAGHLITSLRVVLECDLPIQIAYAGERDLPQQDRDAIAALNVATNVTFLDVLSVFDDSKLNLTEGHWAIKPFAALASSFEQVILMDADAAFLQKPDVLFDQQAFTDHGAYLFHDRLLWKHAFKERHDWFKDQIKEPSTAMLNSLVWTEDYAEGCDSGVVVLDKSRLEILMALLHTSWQNTQEVRDEVTYKLTYGDKESWWLGLELVGAGYAFETHYGSMLGWKDSCDFKAHVTCICSFAIAHLDDNDKLFWYNGGLSKNKLLDSYYYDIPEAWMMDGQWKKGSTKPDISCMFGGLAIPLTELERKALELSVDAAKQVDQTLTGASHAG